MHLVRLAPFALAALAALASVAGCNALIDAPDGEPRPGAPAPAPSSTSRPDPFPVSSTPACGAPDDANNCGACGHSCLGGTCASGRCQPVLLADNERTPSYVLADGDTIYWSDYWNGDVVRYDIPARHRTQLFTGSEPKFIHANAMVFAGDTLFWTSPDAYTHVDAVRWVSKDGKTTGEVAGTDHGGWSGPWALARDTANLYWCNRWGHEVWRMDIATKSPTRIYVDATRNYELIGLAADPGGAGYVFLPSGPDVLRMDKDGGGVTKLGSTPYVVGAPSPEPTPIAIDKGYVYWIGASGALVRSTPDGQCPGVGACPQTVVNGAFLVSVAQLAFDATSVYWTDNGGGRVMRANKDGSSLQPEPLAEGASIDGLAVDDRAIYWTVQFDDGKATNGSIWRLAK